MSLHSARKFGIGCLGVFSLPWSGAWVNGLAKAGPGGRLIFRRNESRELAWRSDAEVEVFRRADCGGAETG